MSMRLVYGPVASRRLGRSLGVDLVPFKTCSYDCSYCQLGRTAHKTVERAPYVATSELLAQLDRQLERSPDTDYVTLAGSGEPTLHSDLGPIVREVKRRTKVPLAVLTNGSLFSRADVRAELLAADLVLPSLDAGEAHLFECVNRPHPAVSFQEMVDGLARFREEYPGEIWLEVFLLRGITASPAAAGRIAEIARGIRPQRIQLNTVARPTAEEHAYSVPAETMLALAPLFGPQAEVISAHEAGPPTGREVSDEDLLALLARRPSTIDGVAGGLGIPAAEAVKRLGMLFDKGRVTLSREETGIFYGVPRASS